MLLIAFVLIFSLTFGTMAAMLRSSTEQKQLEKRLDSLFPARGQLAETAWHDGLLKTASRETGDDVARSGHRPVRSLERLVYQSVGTRSVQIVLAFMVTGAVLGFVIVAWLTKMLPVAVAVALLLGACPVFWLAHLRRKRLKAFEASLPDCIDMCARALRAGYSLVAAIGIVAEQASEPAKSEFAEVFRKQNYGLPVRDAFLETLERVPSPDLRIFLTGIMVQRDTGGNLTEIFDRIVSVIRERLRIQGEIRVHTAQGRMTAWILTMLPGTLLLIINLLDPGYSRPMFQDPLGRKLVYIGSALQLIGGLIVRRIVNGIEV